MIYYALKSAVLLALLYGGFASLLSRETFHRFNRVVLLGIVLLSLLLPAIHITTSNPTFIAVEQYWDNPSAEIDAETSNHPNADANVQYINKESNNTNEEIQRSELSYPPQQENLPIQRKSFWETLYLIGLSVALLRFIWRSVLLARKLQGGLRFHDGLGNTIIVKGGEFPPFSFMHWIVISVSDYEHHRRSILTHEQAHARLGHSWDVLLLEMVQVVQWFNPFVFILSRELKAIHEYEADEAVISQGIDAKQYQQLLVIKAVGNRLQLFANTLNRGSLKQRINMMYQKKSNRWRMLRAAFIIPVAVVALAAFATPAIQSDATPTPQPDALLLQTATVNSTNDTMKMQPLVEYRANQRIGKRNYNTYIVNFGEGVWIENEGSSHIEEQFFRWSFNDSKGMPVMQLNGVTFDQNSLPRLTSRDLRKMEIKKAKLNSIEGSFDGQTQLHVNGDRLVINLITTPVTIPVGVEGNVPRIQTLLLPGNGELYIKNGKATPGDWMHCSVTDWEPTSYGYSVRNEFEKSKTKPGFKCHIYASKETAQKDIDRAEALMKEMGIKNYEVVRNLPKKHFTDSELRQWARDQKAKGIAFSRLYDAMAPNHMDCADVHRQWHIVKAVYGKK